jgi:hypothetical protein
MVVAVGLSVTILSVAYLGFWALGVIAVFVPLRIVILSILYTFETRSCSGSSMARTFWEGVPRMYFELCIFFALGFKAGLIYLAVELAVLWPRLFLLAHDD